MAIYLLHGDAKSIDPFLIKARLDELLKGVEREGNLNFATFDLSASGTSFSDVVSSALTVPFLGGRRVVVASGVRAVEALFRSKSDEEAQEEDGPDLSQAAAATLRAVGQLSQLPEDALLVLVEDTGHLDGRTPFYRALKKVGCKIETFKAMWFDPASGDTRSAVDFVQREASKLGLRLSAKLAERFALLVGSDRGTILKELEKLALYAGTGSRLTIEDIEFVVTESYEAGIFHLVDALGYGNRSEAIKCLADLLDHGAAPPYILAMIARQVRLIARAREEIESGVPAHQESLAKALGEAPFVARKVLAQVNRFPRLDYPTVLEHLMEADVHLKRGTMPSRLALETLITKLTISARA
jgi:DNA polymerase-3 subunit delta